MSRRTIQDRLADAITRAGFAEVEVPTRRDWRGFGPNKRGSFYFVGPSGALRVGRRISQTVSVTGGEMYQRLLAGVPE